MAIVTRVGKGSKLTIEEMDNNLLSLETDISGNVSSITSKLDKGSYTGTAQDLKALIDTKGIVGPTGATGSTGAASTVAGPTGATGSTGAASTVAGPTGATGSGLKVTTWSSGAYALGDQVNYLGKDWSANAAASSSDVPGTSTKWIERLIAYNLDNDFNDSIVSKSPTVIFIGRTVTIGVGVLEIRKGKFIKTFTIATETNYNLGLSSSPRSLVYDYTSNSLLVVVSTVIDIKTQIVLVHDNGTKIIDGILWRFISVANNNIANALYKDKIERNREFIGDGLISSREFSVPFSSLVITPSTTISFNQTTPSASTKSYTVNLLLNAAYEIVTIPIFILVNDGYVFLDALGNYITGRTYRYAPEPYTSSQMVDIVIPTDARTIIFAVENALTDFSVYYSNFPINKEFTKKTDKSLFMGKDLFLIEGQDLPIYRRSISNNIKIPTLCVVSKDSSAKKSLGTIDYSLAPVYQYFNERLILNTNTIKASKVDIIGIYEKDPIRSYANGIDYLYGLIDVNINKVAPSLLTGTTKDIMMIGGSTTNNGLATYTKKYLTDFGITANYKGTMNDDLGTACEATDGWGSDTLFGKRSLVGSKVVYPGVVASPGGTAVKNPFLFLATSDDKSTKGGFCYTYTSSGVAEETSYADYVGGDKETRDFYIFSFDKYCVANSYTNIDVMTLQLGINDIANNAYGLTDLQKFIPELITQITVKFPSIQVGIMPSAAFGSGTNGDNFYTKYIPFMNALNLIVSTTNKVNVKVLSTHIHSDKINQFDYLSTTALYSDGNLTKEIRTQGDAFHGLNNFYLEIGRAVGMFMAWGCVN
jgi:hypothetical protein